jgi:uncharacterized protein (TIGR02266 family)
MPDDRRKSRRVPLSGVRVAFESAAGGVHDAEVANLSRDGLFVRSATPTPVGKRLSLDIKVAGEPAPWAALGRVVWVRPVADGDALPAGMAVKFIDVDDVVVAAIDRLIEARERTEPGLGEKAAPPPRERPLREKTMLGVGGFGVPSPAAPAVPRPSPASPAPSPEPKAASLPLPATPSVPFVPSRERTVLGIGQDALRGDTREPSLPIDLVAKKAPSEPPEAPREPGPPLAPAAEAPHHAAVEAAPVVEEAPAPVERARAVSESRPAQPQEPSVSDVTIPRRRSGAGWWLLLIVLIGAGAACYVFRDQLLPLWRQLVSTVMRNIR